MPKNQPPPAEKWKKKLKNFLNDSNAAKLSRHSVDSATLALLLLRVAQGCENTLIAVFPDLSLVEETLIELGEFLRELNLPLRVLEIPEFERGRLLFPGGEGPRARALNSALTEKFDLVVGSVHALLAPAPSPSTITDARLTLKVGEELPQGKLLDKLVKLDYDDEFEVVTSGEFARRGGIVDIFSPAHDFPCRVEYFGDVIDSLRRFIPETQRSSNPVAEYQVIGRSGITAGGMADSDLFAYFEEGSYRLLTIYPTSIRERIERYSGAVALDRYEKLLRRQSEIGKLQIFCDVAESHHYPEAEPSDVLPPLGTAVQQLDTNAEPVALELRRRMLAEQLQQEATSGSTIVFWVSHEDDIPALEKWCRGNALPSKNLLFAVASISTGFALPAKRLIAVTERELVNAGFTRGRDIEVESLAPSPTPSPQEESTRIEFSLADLDEGDYAVHIDHGIGIFRGFKMLESRGIKREVLVLEYQDNQLLYVPLDQARKVCRYLGAAGKVKLHSISSVRWKRDKENARAGIRSYAADMLRMQAMRQSFSGIVFPPDSAETRAFLREFPFQDTPDQVRASAEIRSDMESSRPMDRLLCGDIGYGKTEIAMRAAFKAVSAGYQVAILAPTTVLAQQHYRTFCERFATYPYVIEVLSRFRSTAEQNEILQKTSTGGIDILIGTHRLCSPELKFRNLGLVVIDEEQRFGVKHKERLRRFRANVDVLAMSATPIPRTLYLAMAGARDLSTLMTAPKLRQPVKTVIAPINEKLIAQAIRAELARGGQVYFLYNRVRTIKDRADQLRLLVPEARIAVAHGRMPEHELEEVMASFLDRKIDCLVCSTIIESGLDVQNANTIIIERADRFGLAELYQLRGRVGRWTRQAYAYLLLPASQLVSSDARKRLSAIRRCTNLGAGFQLALRDLEIRGSGNLLGIEQSGHLNSIGFDLYCQLLKLAVAMIRGEKVEFFPEVRIAIDFISLSLNAPAGILPATFPPEYILGERLRLEAYRRLGALTSEEGLDDFTDELRDRYGKLPLCVKTLLTVARLRILVARIGCDSLTVDQGRIVLHSDGKIYRGCVGIPTLDDRDPPELRLKQLIGFLRKLPPKDGVGKNPVVSFLK